jgi:hypothetical protein
MLALSADLGKENEVYADETDQLVAAVVRNIK